MLYEFRTYRASQGKFEALNRRMRELSWPLMKRLGFRQVGCWIPEGSDDQLVYLLSWKDRAASEAGWQAFLSHPDRIAGKAATDADGPLLASGSAVFWTPTDYAPGS